MAGKTLDEWKMQDIQTLLDAIREIHSPELDELFADEIVDKFKDESLVTLYQYYVVWKRPWKKVLTSEVEPIEQNQKASVP
jgi:hypothetical protein